MTSFLDLVDSGDFCSLSFLLLIVFLAGAAIAGGKPQVQTWGRRIAAGAFIVYAVYAWHTQQPTDAGQWIGIGARAGFCAGLALGLSWMLLSATNFIYTQSLFPLFAKARAIHSHRRRKSLEAERRLVEELQQYQQQRDWEQAAPERERQRQLQEEQQRRQQSDQKRRHDARLECDLLYQRHAAKLAAAFPPERYEAFVNQHLSDDHAPEDVEQRAARLQQMIRDCLDESPGSAGGRFKSLQEIAAYFDERRKEVENLPYDTDTKDSFRTLVNGQEEDAIRKFLSP